MYFFFSIPICNAYGQLQCKKENDKCRLGYFKQSGGNHTTSVLTGSPKQ